MEFKNLLGLTFIVLITQLSFGQDLSEVYDLIENENYKEAITKAELFNDSLICERNNVISFSYYSMGLHEKSIPYYEYYVKECHPNYAHRVNLGDCYFKINQIEKAKSQFLIADKEMPNLSLIKYNLGLIEYEDGNKKKAAEYFTLAINNDGGEVLDFDFVEMQIKALNDIKEYDAAFKSINTILSFWDKNSTEYKYSIVIKSSIYGSKGEYKTAIKELNTIIDSGIDEQTVLLEAYYNLLNFYSKDKKHKKACEIYGKIKELDPLDDILKKYDCK